MQNKRVPHGGRALPRVGMREQNGTEPVETVRFSLAQRVALGFLNARYAALQGELAGITRQVNQILTEAGLDPGKRWSWDKEGSVIEVK